MSYDRLLGGRYEIKDSIGSGAMGSVWRGIDRVLRRQIAIKTVELSQFDPHSAATAAERFRLEGIALAKISHPNVAAVYDSGTDGDIAYHIMELLQGKSLAQTLNEQGPYSFPEGLNIARQIASGLAAAHASRVIHRDLKPGNIVFNNGVPKLVDFGIARIFQQGNITLTHDQMVIGTAAYMSPEQCLAHEITPASDLYGFGCLLFSIFTGKPPFLGDQPTALTHAQVSQPPPLLSERRPDCPQELIACVSRLLSKNPQQRPSAMNVARELDQILSRINKPMPRREQAAQPNTLVSRSSHGHSADPTMQLPMGNAMQPVPAPPRKPVQKKRSKLTTLAIMIISIIAFFSIAALGFHVASTWNQSLSTKPAATGSQTPVAVNKPSSKLPTVTKNTVIVTTAPTKHSDNPLLAGVVDRVANEIESVEQDEARKKLAQEWRKVTKGITKDNIDERLNTFNEALNTELVEQRLTFIEYSKLIASSSLLRTVV